MTPSQNPTSQIVASEKLAIDKHSIVTMQIDHYPAAYQLWECTSGVCINDMDTEEKIAAYLERNPGMSFVALDGSQVIGTVLGGHDGRRGYLHHLVVDENHRRCGIGVKLVESSLAALTMVGITKCHLFVFKDNLLAQHFWKQLGWIPRKDLTLMSKEIHLEYAPVENTPVESA